MREDYEKPAGANIVITNLVSFTLLASAVVVLGAFCRLFKQCCARLSGKGKTDHDVIEFTPVRRISQLRKSYSAPRICIQDYTLVHHEEVPIDIKELPVQPEFGLKEPSDLRPRASSNPGSSPKVSRQISAPVYSTPCGLAKGQTSPLARRSEFHSPLVGSSRTSRSRGETSPLQRKILSRESLLSAEDILTTDLEPQLYRKEACLQRFQTACKNKCGTLDTEVYFDINTSELKVTVICIHQLLQKQHADETNTYVSVKKIPDQKSRRTSLHRKAIDPVFNEEFTFNIEPRDDISCDVLIFGLNHVDKFSASYLRGEACLPLFQIDLQTRRRIRIPFVEIKRPLFSSMYPVNSTSVTGCMLISLMYEPSKKSIVVNPVQVRYVPKKRHVGYGKNVYIKVDLRHKKERIIKMKTQLIEMERMPNENDFYQARFLEQLSLECKSTPVEDIELHISLNHYLFLKSSFIIGQVRFSRTESGYESIHFQNVVENPEKTISVWYEMRGFTTSTALEEVRP